MAITAAERRKQILFQLLEGKTLTRSMLATRFEMDAKTIQRDMDALRNNRWPIEGGHKGYSLRKPSSAEKKAYPDQFLALILLTNGTIDQTVPLVVPDQIRQLKRSLLNIHELEELDSSTLSAAFKLDQSKLSEEMLLAIGKIAKAILSKQCISFDYKSLMQEEVASKLVYPLQLRERDATWYLIAYDTEQKSVRTYALTRATLPVFSTYSSPLPSHEELMPYLTQDNFGIWFDGSTTETMEVKIKFFDHAARLIQERTYHDSQKLEVISPDEVIATYQVNEFNGIRIWLRKFIDQTEILSPKDLRDEMIYDLKSALERYKA